MRSGFLTSAAARGASIFKMADQSRHKNMDTLPGYVRDAELFKDHSGRGLLYRRKVPQQLGMPVKQGARPFSVPFGDLPLGKIIVIYQIP